MKTHKRSKVKIHGAKYTVALCNWMHSVPLSDINAKINCKHCLNYIKKERPLIRDATWLKK